MASDSHEPTRRSKNHRSSIDDSVEPSKRRKHRHRRHKHDDDVAERVEEGEREGEETSRHVARSRPDSDLEEGEIIEDADDSIMGIHSAQSEAGDRSSLPENGKDIENNLVKKSSYDASKEYESPVKNKPEMSDNDDSNDSNSHIKRSQSLSISEKGFPLKTTHKKDDPISKDAKKASNDLDDEKLAVRNWDSRHGYRDGMREKERERSSSRSRYRELDRDRERSRESWDKERYGRREKIEDHGGERHKEKRSSRDRVRETEMERDRERDKEREREKSRDRERQRIREREERELERERERRKERELEWGRENGRNRSRDRERYGGRESERKRSRDRESYGDRESGRNRNRDRDDDRKKDLRNSRDDETDYKNRAKKDKENGATRDEEEQEDYQERVALQLVDQEEDDVDRIKEESRRRRQAILEKYKMQQQQQLHKPQLENEDKEHIGQVSEVDATSVSPETSTMRNKEDAGTTISGDPSLTVSKSPTENVTASEKTSGVGGLGEGTPKSERSGGDMFCDDIFGDSPTGVRKTGKGDGLAIERGGLHDNWDDAEGYYSFRFGEILDGRYEVAAAHGKGVFSTVVRAKDLRAGPGDPEEVAIKIIRNNEHMHKAGKEELVILKKLVGADPEDRRHCVRFLSSFNYRNHLCLVFESLNMNLREVLKKFGRNIGLKLTAVRLYAKQLFIALKHLKNCGVLHSDIKPDNMLVNEAKNVLKLCDFGNAMFAGKNEITPYLVSRFYRAPEIILGLTYDYPLDIWSVGCCLFELYSGKVLFPGATNNDMLRLHMELKGLFPKKMLRKGAFTEQHFDQDLNFLAVEEDPVTKRAMRRLITSIKPKDIGAIVTGSPGEDPKMLANFKDLLEKIFILDPDKRLTVSQALSHPFITGK